MSKFAIISGLVATATIAVAFVASPFASADDHAETTDAKPTMKAKIGEPAPKFTLTNHDGEEMSLPEGKIVVLEWFNDQCPYVQKWYKEGNMNELADKYEGKDVVWIAIDSSNFSNVEQNAEIASEWKIDRPLLDDSTGKVGKMYDAKTTPHMYIINTDGILVYAGGIDDKPSSKTEDIDSATNYVAKALDELLAGETVSTPESKPYGCGVKY